VLSSEAPKQKTFEQVKDEVKADYLASEKHRLIEALAKKLVDEVKGGKPMTAIEGEAKNKVEKTEPVTRKMVLQSLSVGMVAQAFSLPKDRVSYGPSPDGQTLIIFRVADIIPASAPSLTETDSLHRGLEEELANQTLTEYTDALKKRYGTSINPAELNAAVGVSEE
jgi:peptidyl-prolyl cis-trans isomerase D